MVVRFSNSVLVKIAIPNTSRDVRADGCVLAPEHDVIGVGALRPSTVSYRETGLARLMKGDLESPRVSGGW